MLAESGPIRVLPPDGLGLKLIGAAGASARNPGEAGDCERPEWAAPFIDARIGEHLLFADSQGSVPRASLKTAFLRF
jgi:hypothetical protein